MKYIIAFVLLLVPAIASALTPIARPDVVPFQRIDYTQHCLSSYLQKLVDIDGESL